MLSVEGSCTKLQRGCLNNDLQHEQALLGLTAELIAIPSLSGKEEQVLIKLEQIFQAFGWPMSKIEVAPNRYNLLVSFGKPRVILSTHVDVVPAPESMFNPQMDEAKVVGRGACDAKGVIVSMISAALRLRSSGKKDFALLFVVGEETDGIGAMVAGEYLKKQGVEYIVNGEPTRGKMMQAQKGTLLVKMDFKGKSCHSGYPEAGEDANAAMIQAASEILRLDLGRNDAFGQATLTIGEMSGGVACNIVSGSASLSCLARTVGDYREVVAKIEAVMGKAANLRVVGFTDPVKFQTLSGFEYDVASYGSDISRFIRNLPDVKYFLYGPGSILNAHTDGECITGKELLEAVNGYQQIVARLG